MATKQNAKEYPIQIIREDLRRRSTQEAALLARSVGRLTSCDVQPCLEYDQEIANEHAVIDRLLYIQQCRNSLERCIGSGSARLRYRWRDGRVTETQFRRVSPGRVGSAACWPGLPCGQRAERKNRRGGFHIRCGGPLNPAIDPQKSTTQKGQGGASHAICRQRHPRLL